MIRICIIRNLNGDTSHYDVIRLGLLLPLKAFSISHTTWEWTAQDRDGWRTAVHKGAKSCEAHRISAAEQGLQARKNSADEFPAAATITYPRCKRTFRAWIGLSPVIYTPTHSDPRMTTWSSSHRWTNHTKNILICRKTYGI